MSKPKIIKGFYWHCHHGVLVEYCYDYDDRVDFIKACKPLYEIAERLRLFQPVKGKLPIEVIKAGEACGETWDAYDKGLHDRALSDYYRACEANRGAIEKLHAEECPDCSWNGEKLIFDKELKKVKNGKKNE